MYIGNTGVHVYHRKILLNIGEQKLRRNTLWTMSYATSGYYTNQALGPRYCLMSLPGREGDGNGVRGSGSAESDRHPC